MPKRVVITGLGLLSSIGNSFEEITESLQLGKSGVVKIPEWEALGIKSCIAGTIKNFDEKLAKSGISKKYLNCMSEAAVYCTLATQDALKDAKLLEEGHSSQNIACFVGSGVSSTKTIYENADMLFKGNIRKMSPYTITRSMSSSCSAAISNAFQLKGRSYSISSACATGLHNIGHAYEMIQHGVTEIAVAGGGEEVTDITTSAFMAMRMALSKAHINHPEESSRPYDKDRDGFVMSGGAGIIILEELESALKRNVKIYGEIIGFDANADGHDMIMPEPNGTQTGNCIKKVLENAGIQPEDVDYINTHGTSTVIGDLAELKAIKLAFENKIPDISSTKSMTGHPIGAAGGIEVIFCLSMLHNQYVAPSINIFNLSDECKDYPIITKTKEKKMNVILSNNFGFGGTNASVLLKRFNH